MASVAFEGKGLQPKGDAVPWCTRSKLCLFVVTKLSTYSLQMMVQRALSSKSLSHAQGGALLAGYLKFLPLFLMVMPGMVSRVLWPDEVGCVDPLICERICGNRNGCSNIAYPRLVMRLLPVGLRGLLIAIMLASLVSDLSSIFNSASSLFTIDVWVRFRKAASQREMLIVGRVFNLVLLAVSIAWIPLIQAMQGGQLYIYIQAIAAYLAPPIAAIYLLAILWHRTNEKVCRLRPYDYNVRA